MKKPNKQQIENASNEQLAEWSYILVLKKCWHITKRDSQIKSYYLPTFCIKCGAKRVHEPKQDWNPAENIEQAFELVEEIRKYQYVVCIETPVLNWHVSFFKQVGGVDGEIICYHNEDEKLSKAITIAALLAVVEGE